LLRVDRLHYSGKYESSILAKKPNKRAAEFQLNLNDAQIAVFFRVRRTFIMKKDYGPDTRLEKIYNGTQKQSALNVLPQRVEEP
jgi:hypothetical protein